MNALPSRKDMTDTQTHNDIAAAKRVLKMEIEGLQALAESLGEDFANAVEMVDKMKQSGGGRLIVAGIGKSGHVARKITATLASTGTPASFVHPNEASHGDLGMITERDVVLLLSNSGQNSELTDIIGFTRRFAIPLIGMTSNPNSELAKHSDIALVMPKMPEACSNGMAPTTSTTMMLAFGDALAVALLDRMGLTPEQFKVFHPGGKLGAQLRKVSDLMLQTSELPLVTKEKTMAEVLLVMTEKNLGSALIVDAAGKLEGILTDGDLKRHMQGDLLSRQVGEIMSSGAKSIKADMLLAEAVDIMLNKYEHPITSLVVLDANDKVQGLIRLQECLKAGVV